MELCEITPWVVNDVSNLVLKSTAINCKTENIKFDVIECHSYSLQWCPMDVMASQITGNSTVFFNTLFARETKKALKCFVTVCGETSGDWWQIASNAGNVHMTWRHHIGVVVHRYVFKDRMQNNQMWDYHIFESIICFLVKRFVTLYQTANNNVGHLTMLCVHLT